MAPGLPKNSDEIGPVPLSSLPRPPKKLDRVDTSPLIDLDPESPITLSTTQEKIKLICDNFSSFLIEKNKRYGDSALNPLRIFSKVDAESSICIRLDDKIKRIKNSTELRKNDVGDMIGYLILLCCDKDWLDFEEFID